VEETLELLLEDGFQVNDGDLVATAMGYVLGRV
jgi:hypothetical protein